MRLFFAVPLEEAAVQAVLEVQRRLRAKTAGAGIRWVSAPQLHYTLKFLGEVDPSRVDGCVDVARGVAQSEAPFDLMIGGAGGFPRSKAPRVLWLGTVSDPAPLVRLATGLDEALAALGFERETRPFKPHLTLARVKTREGERSAANALGSVEVGDVARSHVVRVVLMESQLLPSGAKYSVVDTFGLAQSG